MLKHLNNDILPVYQVFTLICPTPVQLCEINYVRKKWRAGLDFVHWDCCHLLTAAHLYHCSSVTSEWERLVKKEDRNLRAIHYGGVVREKT